ncbi:hypothetical protein [Streptomyces sp. NBC_00690]|uniref:hypothetical protein n=1 Tax=Streptomyces sp. NBC_00690 TaxID=2975808 RepID=UPI002E2D3970|nr:hypothetical protein [Streptomyces sp. NBC_00690]
MKLRFAAAAVASCAAFAMTISPAQADNVASSPRASVIYCQWLDDNGGPAVGMGCFDHVGDVITAEDRRSDGLRVVVETKYNYNRANDECHAAGGSGTTKVCNYNMKESGKVSFRVLTRNGANGANVHTGAWGPWNNISG